MLDEALDPRPVTAPSFGNLLTADRAYERNPDALLRDLRAFWNDGASSWSNLRNFDHWIERSRR